MLSLIRKDFIAARWFLLTAILLFAAQLATMSTIPAGAMLVTLVFCGLFAFGSLGIEEMQGTEVTWCSLPVDRRQIVLARYATTILGLLLGLSIRLIVGGWNQGLLAYALVLFMLLTIAALFLPCYFRFGAGKGLAVFAMLFLGVIVFFAAIGALIASATNWLDLADMPDEERIAMAEAWFDVVGPYLAAVLIIIAVAAISTSALISIRWYEVRDY